MAKILDGKQVAAALKTELAARAAALRAQGGKFGLAIVLVEGDAASRVYTNALVRLATSLGIPVVVEELAADVSQSELHSVIDRLNDDDAISGILPMMPLPAGLEADQLALRLSPDKDVDAMHPLNVGLVAAGRSRWAPCTPRAVMAVLDYYGVELAGRPAVVIGRSNVVGKPLFHLLLARSATVTVCHSKTKDLAAVVQQADIVVAAVGRPGLIGGGMIKPGAIVVDVGINELDGKIVGDVDFAAVEKIAAAITPVPGGVGTVSNLMVMDAVLRPGRQG
ncbi:MAG: bifunctional 5,10-methylenetetrahydrofolate dehydrogenase/5,10-methenyltetrahydrofolate cyclohydrolase [Negativicutes bacterium]|nr:bifunctional 5,10-methylenetetrahydrofolate dehydrogenase/5,10-methenyltetrahydrofolate cyclohydrolase [Negativicutes bacterium]